MSFTECNLVVEGSHLGIGPGGWIFVHLSPIHVRRVVLSRSAPKAIETAACLRCWGGCCENPPGRFVPAVATKPHASQLARFSFFLGGKSAIFLRKPLWKAAVIKILGLEALAYVLTLGAPFTAPFSCL